METPRLIITQCGKPVFGHDRLPEESYFDYAARKTQEEWRYADVNETGKGPSFTITVKKGKTHLRAY